MLFAFGFIQTRILNSFSLPYCQIFFNILLGFLCFVFVCLLWFFVVEGLGVVFDRNWPVSLKVLEIWENREEGTDK